MSADEKNISSPGSMVHLELVRSVIGTPKWMRDIVRTLGLKKMHQVVTLPANGATLGAVKKVSHLVSIKKSGK